MKTALKIFGLIIATVLFLSINVKGKTVFAHIYGVISPGTKVAQQATEDFFDSSVHKTETFSKKIFNNSVPKVKDSVKSKASALARKEVNEPLEKITEEEKEELDELIKTHR